MKLISKLICLVLFSLYSCNSETKKSDPQSIKNGAEVIKRGIEILKPQDLIVQMFKNTDVVIFADHHFIKQNVDYVSSLIPFLHKIGVRLFFSEFLLAEDSTTINNLIANSFFDEKLARKLSHNSLYQWAYQEYIEQMRAFWEFNHELPKEQWIRLIGTQPKFKWEIFQTDNDWNDPEKRKEWGSWDGMNYEKRWAKLIAGYSLEKNQKAVVFCGLHHGTTEFHKPIVIDGKFYRFEDDKMGNFLYNSYGKRVKTVALHYPWFSRQGYSSETYVIPFGGVLDSIAEKSGYPIALFSENNFVYDSTSVYSQGYNPLHISNLCDAYILVAPVCKQVAVTFIPDFINNENLAESKRQEYSMRGSQYTARAFNDTIKAFLDEVNFKINALCKQK